MTLLARPLSAVALAVAVGLASAAAGAQASAVPGGKPVMLFGVVTNINGVRIGGVELTLANTTMRTISNDSGEFFFENPPTGRVRLNARRVGFKPQEKGFKLDAGQSKQVDMELDGIPNELDTVNIYGRGGSGRMAEFYARRMVGIGAFITRADIERRKPYRPSDLLRTITGVRIIGGDDMREHPQITMGRTPVGSNVTRRNVQTLAGDCRVNYYVDGNWVPPGTFHPDDLSPGMIEAIEVYRGPSEVPAKFRQRETACGLIVIWTREPPPKEKSGERS